MAAVQFEQRRTNDMVVEILSILKSKNTVTTAIFDQITNEEGFEDLQNRLADEEERQKFVSSKMILSRTLID